VDETVREMAALPEPAFNAALIAAAE